MPELTDDQLDGLFRKSVEEFDTPFDPAAWQDMNARLDANDRTKPGGASVWKNLLRWGLPVALLLLLTGGSWLVYYNANSGAKNGSLQKITSSEPGLMSIGKRVSQSQTPRLANTKSADTKPTRSPEQPVREAGQLADRGGAEKVSGLAEKQLDKSAVRLTETTSPEVNVATKRTRAEASPGKALASPKVSSATKSVTSAYRQKETNDKLRTNRSRLAKASSVTDNGNVLANRLNRTNSFKNSNRLSSQKRPGAQDNSVAFSTGGYTLSATPSFSKRSIDKGQGPSTPDVVSTENKVVVSDAGGVSSGALPAINELASRPANWPKSLTFTSRPVEALSDTTAQRVTPKLPSMRGLSVRFVVSPDLTTVGLKNFDRPGTNIGLLLEYRIASRWSIQAGVIQSTKVYRALPGEYGFLPDNLEKYKSNLAEVDGQCNMLDIPINLRYDVVVKPRKEGLLPTRWFISSGVTSYSMKQENYSYTYYHYYPTNVSEWSNPNPGGYRLSNLNLSVGYERSISRRLSWQVEPFIKAPLKGVGFFKVNLLSTGAFFSLRYKL